MLIHLLLFNLALFAPLVHGECYSKSPQTWICNNTLRPSTEHSSNLDYPTALTSENLERFILKNYHLEELRIHDYAPTLRLLNASNNQFERVVLTAKHRYTSRLRQLVLQSNGIRRLAVGEFVVPESVQIISLANNQLEILDARIFVHLKNLTRLDLRNNRLKRILPQLLLNLKVLLANNPMDCQCTPEFYQNICAQSTSLPQTTVRHLVCEFTCEIGNELDVTAENGSSNCVAPYFAAHLQGVQSLPFMRFSTFTLTCPIHAEPSPLIVWSTPFGTLTAMDPSDIDLLLASDDEPIYVTLTALAGPLTARTRHTLHASDTNQLSITRARAALRHRISCSGTNMLGNYTHEFDFAIHSYVHRRALWQIIYTMAFGLFMALVAGASCVATRRTSYFSADQLRTPPIYPTMTANSAARTPPNFELNQWLSLAAANISGTLEQVRDRLRLGVQHVSEHMGRASELLTYGVQHAGGTIRHAAETSAAYLHSIREASQQRLATMRVQTLSSLRNPGNLMRAGMNMLTTQVNSLRDYCGVTTGQMLSTNDLLQQQLRHSQHSPQGVTRLHHTHPISVIAEDDEAMIESTALMNQQDQTPYVGQMSSAVVPNAAGIGQLDAAGSSVLLALTNFNEDQNGPTGGQMTSGIGTFHDLNDELVSEPERLIMYGQQRPVS